MAQGKNGRSPETHSPEPLRLSNFEGRFFHQHPTSVHSVTSTSEITHMSDEDFTRLLRGLVQNDPTIPVILPESDQLRADPGKFKK